MARKRKDILILADSTRGHARSRLADDLDILYPDRVAKIDFTTTRITAATLAPYACVITEVGNGANLPLRIRREPRPAFQQDACDGPRAAGHADRRRV